MKLYSLSFVLILFIATAVIGSFYKAKETYPQRKPIIEESEHELVV